MEVKGGCQGGWNGAAGDSGGGSGGWRWWLPAVGGGGLASVCEVCVCVCVMFGYVCVF